MYSNDFSHKTQHMKNIKYSPPSSPTLHFIGVSTHNSSIMKIFPHWASYLGLKGARIEGMNLALNAEDEAYFDAVQFIKKQPNSYGALVTSHKINLLKASEELFDELDHAAHLLKEISCISKKNGKLRGFAKDIITSGLSIDAIISPNYWQQTRAELLCMGAGGANLALTSYLLQQPLHLQPKRIILTDLNKDILTERTHIHRQIKKEHQIEYVQCTDPKDHDELLKELPPGSMIINGTGLGKDLPGSPLTNQALFPQNGIVWEYNYRGERLFLQQANAQKSKKNLSIHDGWKYFIYGWTQIIAEVFHINIPTEGKVLEDLSEIARRYR